MISLVPDTLTIPDFGRLERPLAVVAHDAGAANLLIAWLRAAGARPDFACMEGPAAKLWAAAFADQPTTGLEGAVSGAATLVSGTGWASALEHDARSIAASRNIRSVAIVDHWVNYRMRFERQGAECLPNSIWVADQYAAARARETLPECTVEAFDNAYLAEQVADIERYRSAASADAGGEVCYALEPIKLPWGSDDARPGEFQALDYFLANSHKAGIPAGARISLRPHPSDPPGKYDAWIAGVQGRHVSLATDEPLGEALARAQWVVGCESYVLLIGLAAGLPVMSSLPPWGNEFRLPYPEILQLRHM